MDEVLFAPVQHAMTSPVLSPSDSFRDEGLGEEAHVAKGVAYSLPVSVPAFRRSPKKGSSDNDDERVSERSQLLGVTMSHICTCH